ncbi:MAG: cell division protein FtsZ [Alphaproteobacteria bacterium]|nr:cell division protein FtsZ [Alphaproteobacteria bacterium]
MSINISVPPTHELKPRITVIGVGGAGCNAVNNMISSHLEGVEFVVSNTDAQSLANSQAQMRVQLGANVTQGLGAGARPEIGRAAADESLDQILEHIDGTHMLFVTAGMGGGTGTGAAPVIAKAARERGILTVGCVTKPFQFEGRNRMRLAEEGISELTESVDTLIVIPNQNLFRVANAQTTFSDAFKMADKVLYSGVRGVTDLMVMPGLINLDFADVRSVMMEMGKAMMGTGDAEGDNRALDAAAAAIANPLLDDVSLAGARGVLVNITGGPDLTLFEVDEIVDHIRQQSDDDVNLIFGASQDDSMHNSIRVSVVATGIDCPKKVDNVENIISDINVKLEKNNLEEISNVEKNEPINNNDKILSEPINNLGLNEETIQEETIQEVNIQEEINITQESFIPPEPEVIEKEQTKEEVKIDPFTEAEVLNASSNIKEEKIDDTEPQVKQQEGIIKRFSAKALFGNSAKKNNDIKPSKEELLSNVENNQSDGSLKEKEELSLSQDISMKAADKNSNEDTLDIPAFLRRQKE